MSEVTLTIGGRSYAVACADGEEPHVQRLGQVIDAKLNQLGSGLGPSESRNFLFASLLLADDLHEKVKEMEGLKQAEASARSEKESLAARLPALENERQEADRKASEMAAQIAAVNASAEQARKEAEQARTDLETLRAQQASAGEELQAALAERDKLQGEANSRRGEHDQLRIELDGARAKIGKLGEEAEMLREERDNLIEELDAMRAAKQRRDSEFEESQGEAQRIASELEELRNAPPPDPEFLPLGADPDLAPALERFAEMLETCAAKLEGKASTA